jgi:hypothetical protein
VAGNIHNPEEHRLLSLSKIFHVRNRLAELSHTRSKRSLSPSYRIVCSQTHPTALNEGG